MKFSSLFSCLAAAALAALPATAAAAHEHTAAIYIQPIAAAAPAPALLGEVTYDAAALTGEVTAFEFPELPEGARVVRIGVYDAAAGAWASATSVASAANFAKGYAPHFVLTVESPRAVGGHGGGRVVGAALRGVRIDAGQTRDFGPQAVMRAAAPGPQVELNKPVVLSPEGKLAPEEQPKSFIQKYWWVIALVFMLSLAGGGGEEGGK